MYKNIRKLHKLEKQLLLNLNNIEYGLNAIFLGLMKEIRNGKWIELEWFRRGIGLFYKGYLERRIKMINVGTNSFVAIKEIETVSPPESAPIKRMVNLAKDEGRCIELTYGKRVKSVIVLKSGKIVLSAILPNTLAQRIAEKSWESMWLSKLIGDFTYRIF